MRHLRILFAVLFACLAPMAMPAMAIDIDAGPIWNNDDAQRKCPSVCGSYRNWDGNWRTVETGRNSVCACYEPPYPMNFSRPRPAATASCSIPPEGACRSCAVTCSPGREALCLGGETRRDVCVAQPSCSCR